MRKSGIAIAVAALVSVVLFQNCGGSSAGSDSRANFSSMDSGRQVQQDVTVYNVKAGEDVMLVMPEKHYKEFMSEGECEWVYKTMLGEIKSLDNPDRVLILDKIGKNQEGFYQLTCSNRKQSYTVKFRVMVDGGIVDPDAGGVKGTYHGVFIQGGKDIPFVTLDNISQAGALEHCKGNISATDSKNGIRCTWAGTVIFSRAEYIPPPPTDTLIGYYRRGSSWVEHSRQGGMTEAQALSKCTSLANQYSNYSVQCKWGSKVIFQR